MRTEESRTALMPKKKRPGKRTFQQPSISAKRLQDKGSLPKKGCYSSNTCDWSPGVEETFQMKREGKTEQSL